MAEALIPDLFAEDYPQVLLHGDFHHYNVLSAQNVWRAIDPKGVIGPVEYEASPLLTNMLPDSYSTRDRIRRTERRIAILSERLGLDRQRLRTWAIVHAVLSAWWDLEDNTGDGQNAIACAEMFARVKV
jgi:streptomycin 6-kinase